MPKGKTIGYKVRDQVKRAIRNVDIALDHLMAADVTAKGGTIDGRGKFVPAGVDMKDPTLVGHPVMNQWLPYVLEIASALKEALKNMSKAL
jgi:hypothetical protein